MKKAFRVFLFLLAALSCLTVFAAVAANAAEDVVYYYIDSEAGADNVSGRDAAKPLRTYTEACRNAVRDGAERAYIVVKNAYVFAGNAREIAHPDTEFVLTSRGEHEDYGASGAKLVISGARRYYLGGATTFENLTLERDNSLVVVAQYNPLTFGEGMTMTCTGETDRGLWVVGGYQSPEDTVDTTLDSHITIKSGKFARVIGGTRQNWNAQVDGLVYSGTHYVDISGGEIDMLLCGSYAKHVSDSAVLHVSGGEFGSIYLGGDDTRRLDNDAAAVFTGGNVRDGIFVNNVIGAANITVAGIKTPLVSLTYKTEKLRAMAKEKGKTKTLYYDARDYSAVQIEAFGVGFDRVENIAAVYAAADATGSGRTADDPAPFADAFRTAAESGAALLVKGRIELTDFAEPTHAAAIAVRGADENAALVLHGSYTLGGDTTLSSLTFDGDGAFDARRGTLTVAADVKTTAKMNISGAAVLRGGSFGKVTDAGRVLVDGAAVDSITGGSTAAEIEVLAGSVGSIASAETATDSFSLTIGGGEVGTVLFRAVRGSLSYVLFGGKVGGYAVEGENVRGTLRLGDGIAVSSLGAAAALFETDSARVVYLAGGGSGSGVTANAPVGSLADAYAALGEAGGTLVISGTYRFSSAFVAPAHTGRVTVTSVYGGVDYRRTADACLVLDANYYIGGETLFDSLHIDSAKAYVGFFANYKPLTFGADVTTGIAGTNTTYPCIVGGTDPAVLDAKDLCGSLTLDGGKWERVRLGNSKGTPVNCDVTLTMNGGEVVDFIYMSSAQSHSGDLTVVMNGGKTGYGIVGHGYGTDSQTYSGNLTVTVNGGEIRGRIMPRYAKAGHLVGSWTVNIAGGDFAHCAEIRGTENMGENMTSTLNFSNGFNPDANISGTYTFTNPIRYFGADPWILYHNGAYYYTATGGDRLMLYKVANIGDLSTAAGAVIYAPEDGHEWSHNMWSPEIHYFSAEQVGEKDAGWYCFVTSDDGQDWNYSSLTGYVIKCLDGDDLMGRWGNPVTGEVNVPEPIVFPDTKHPDKFSWIGGMSTLEVGGENYIIFVNEYNRDTTDFYQALQIAKYKNPWTIIGEPSEICVPTYDWEKVGGGDGVHPYTVECITGVYGDDGSVFVSYAGSAYWTSAYAVGCMTFLGGDPMDPAAWKKSENPIFSKSAEVNGCAHACYVTDTDGSKWAMYHAYITGDKNTGRYAFLEPYSASAAGGLVIGDGSGHPAPLSTVYTAGLNPTPVAEKAVGFGSVNRAKIPATRSYDGRFADVTENHWFYAFVERAYEMALANGTSQTKFSPDAAFTTAQALTAAANIHSVYNGKTVRAAGAGEAWYLPYAEYCVKNGIVQAGQFTAYDAPITRGDMAIIFAGILPERDYAAVVTGAPADVTADMACSAAVQKLFAAGIIGGDAGTGKYRPGDSIRRSEACVIFTRIAVPAQRLG